MAWTTPRAWAPDYEVTPADMNLYVRDNLNEVRAGGIAITGQTAGDVVIASSAQNWTRVVGLTYLSNVLSVPGRIRLSTEETGAATSGDVYANALVLAWAKIASGGGVLDGVNVSTSTDAGDYYRITFASAMPDNYVVITTPLSSGTNQCSATVYDHTTTQCSVIMEVNRTSGNLGFSMVAIGGHDD